MFRSGSADAESTDLAMRARGICLKLLTARPHSRVELAQAMLRRGIPEEVGESVLDRLGEVGLVDDAVFAESAVYSGHTHRGLARQALRAELDRRGVADDVARAAVAAVQTEDEEHRARELVRRKLRTVAERDPAERDPVVLARRLTGLLARKGYPEELALRVVRAELGPTGWAGEGELDPSID